MKWWIISAFFALWGGVTLGDSSSVPGNSPAPANSAANATSSAAADDGPPAPASMVSTYLSIGRDLLVRVSLVRRTLDDLTLDPPVRQQANQCVDSCCDDMRAMIAGVQAGKMPSMNRIKSVPVNLRAARVKLMQLIGPDQAAALNQKLQSLRGEARAQMAQMRVALGLMQMTPEKKTSSDTVLTTADAAVEELPDTDLQGDDYTTARDSMNKLFGQVHDNLAGIFTVEEQSQLGPHFSQLARTPAATQPSSNGG